MPLSTDAQRHIVRALNDYCFKDTWNEIHAEYRVNIELTPIATRFVTGSVFIGQEQIMLPDAATSYSCFKFARGLSLGGLNQLPFDTWIPAENICNDHSLLLSLYQATGKLLPRGQFYIRHLHERNITLVCVTKPSVLRIIGIANYHDPFYLTIYRDSDIVNPITTKSFIIPSTNTDTVISSIETKWLDSVTTNREGTTLVVDGVEYNQNKPFTFNAGQFVEITCDTNVVGAYTVNVSNSTSGYHSNVYKEDREILHCPKALNPTNKVITHNTCTLFVRSNTANKGLYLHRADAESVGQLTHMDLSVSSRVITALSDHLGDDDVSIYVRVRTHSKDNVLIDELSYLNMLYTESDDNIVRHLRGTLDPNLTFWTAAALEQDGYIALMFDTPDTNNPALLGQYMQSLGYYSIAEILAPHTQTRHGVRAGDFGCLTFTKPYMLNGVSTLPLVYLDTGLKLRSDCVKHADIDTETALISVDPSRVHIPVIGSVTVTFLEKGFVSPYIITVDPSSPTITIPFADAVVYERVSLTSTATGGVATSDYSYREITNAPGTVLVVANNAGGATLTFGPSLYGKTLVIRSIDYAFVETRPIDGMINSRQPFVFPLTIACANDATTSVPLLGYNSLDVYINGRRLVEDIDFVAKPLVIDNNVALCEVVVTTMEYVDSGNTGNIVEVVAHTGVTVLHQSGYVFDRNISYDTQIDVVYSGLSRVFTDGKLDVRYSDEGSYLTSSYSDVSGKPFDITTFVPRVLHEALSTYPDTTDQTRWQIINRYFNRIRDMDTSFLMLTASHRLYSPFITQLVYDILNDRFTPVNEPVNQEFINQFESYRYWQDRDPAITDPDKHIDRRYVDISPLYYSVALTPELYRIIHRLIKMLIGVDTITSGETYNG